MTTQSSLADIHSIGNHLLRCDVLVIGGGIAGLVSAISATDYVDNVVLVDKAFSGKNSQAALSAAQMVIAPPGTDIDAWVEDLVESGDYICHQDIFREVLVKSYENLKRLEEFGVEYPKDRSTGNLSLLKSRGTRLVKTTQHLGKALGEFTGGEAVTMAYRNAAAKRKVKIMNRIYVATLLTGESGNVVGAMGFDSRSGDAYTILAKSVVISTGGTSFRGDFAHVWFVTGDGYRLAYEAGAELENMEFNQFNTGSPFFWWEGTGVAVEFGARFLNAKREEFMKKYHPLGNRADVGFITRAMTLETRIGNGPPFYLSLNEIPDPKGVGYGGGYWSSEHMVGWMPKMIDTMKQFYSFDVFKEPAEWMPVYNISGGGIRAGIDCSTSIPGLFVSGQAMSMSPDIHTGWSFARYTWSGYKVGESAGRYAKSIEYADLLEEKIQTAKLKLFEPLARKGDHTIDEVYAELRRILFTYDVLLLKHKERLEKALSEVTGLYKNVFPKLAPADPHELMKYEELESMLLSAEMTLRASLMRTESRTSHFREDYPFMDNDNWLKWIVIKRSETGEMSLRAEPLPVGSNYKIVPPSGKRAVAMPRQAWDAIKKSEPCPVSWVDSQGTGNPN